MHKSVVHFATAVPGTYFCCRIKYVEKQHGTDTRYRDIRQPERRSRKNDPLCDLCQLPGDARVVVIDCDSQHSILKCRKADIKKYGETVTPYDVLAYEANDKQAMTTLMEKLHNDPSIDVVLMDSPGSLKVDGLIPLFVNTDVIVVPFHYDLVTVPSTASFLLFIDRLKKAVGEQMKARLFMVPNLNDGRVGKRHELVLWENTREAFSNYGYVTAKIPKRADMERFSTMAALDRQAGIVSPVFDKIYSGIFDTLQPIREPTLSGIQLTANLNQNEEAQQDADEKQSQDI